MNNIDMDDLALGLVAGFLLPPAGLYLLIRGPGLYLRLGAFIGLAVSIGAIVFFGYRSSDPCFDASGIKRGPC